MRYLFPKAKILLPIIVAFPLTIVSYFLDAKILEFFEFLHNDLFDKVANWFTQVESVVFIFIVVMIIFMIEMAETKWILPLISTIFMTMAASYFIKIIFMRRRPYDNIGFLGFADSSFPSAHAAIAFACATLLRQIFPRMSVFLYIFAIATSLSRVYLERHYLSDVIAGATLGYVIGLLMLFFYNKYVLRQEKTIMDWFSYMKNKKKPSFFRYRRNVDDEK